MVPGQIHTKSFYLSCVRVDDVVRLGVEPLRGCNLAEGLKLSFLALSGRGSSLVQTFCEFCVQLDINHPSVHMTRRFVIQGCPTDHQHANCKNAATVSLQTA